MNIIDLLISILLLVQSLFGGAAQPTTPPPPPEVECTEDMECWDCTTMGNLICGWDAIVDDTGRVRD